MTEVRLVLISHTNVGKTSLARTLLRRDVGEILDATHTTLDNHKHVLEETADSTLVLWDTPGFGDTARLKKRLEQSEQPLSSLLASAWDRVADRTLWCAQQAMSAVRDEADLVLYLVNASEDPEFATYIELELAILAWLDKPVLVLLNQLPPREDNASRSELLQRWEAALAKPPVRGVLALDSHERVWLEEHRLLARVGAELEGDAAARMAALLEHWEARQRERFEGAVHALADALAETACDREPVGRGRPRRLGRLAALRRLGNRLAQRTRTLDAKLIDLEALEGDTLRSVEADLTATHDHGERPDPTTGAAGGAVVGAGAGAALDLLFGGLTFGVFTALGASLSAAAAWRWCWHAIDERTLGWSSAFIGDLAAEYAARWLAITHHGRARGPFEEHALVSWRTAVTQVRSNHLAATTRVTDAAARAGADAGALRTAAITLMHGLVVDVLLGPYPTADWLLRLPAEDSS